VPLLASSFFNIDVASGLSRGEAARAKFAAETVDISINLTRRRDSGRHRRGGERLLFAHGVGTRLVDWKLFVGF